MALVARTDPAVTEMTMIITTTMGAVVMREDPQGLTLADVITI